MARVLTGVSQNEDFCESSDLTDLRDAFADTNENMVSYTGVKSLIQSQDCSRDGSKKRV